MAAEDWQEHKAEDRLPWLETAEDAYRPGMPMGRLVALVLLGLAVIAAIVFAVYRAQHARQADGGGEVINAQEGDYKVRPENPGGSNVSGEGESAIAASQGKDASGSGVDLKQAAETPIPAKKATTPAAPVKAVPTIKAAVPGASGAGGAVVQLGSFPSEASANEVWSGLAKKFSYLAPLGKGVTRAEVGKHVVYRLRVNAGSVGQAGEICAKLTAAKQPCYIPHD